MYLNHESSESCPVVPTGVMVKRFNNQRETCFVLLSNNYKIDNVCYDGKFRILTWLKRHVFPTCIQHYFFSSHNSVALQEYWKKMIRVKVRFTHCFTLPSQSLITIAFNIRKKQLKFINSWSKYNILVQIMLIVSK